MGGTNSVLRICLQSGAKGYAAVPESVILGYAKTLLMNDSTLKMLFSEKDLIDLEGARRVMEENKLDLELIRSNLFSLIPMLIPDDEEYRKIREFVDLCEAGAPGRSSEDLIALALEVSLVPFAKVFAKGCTKADVDAYYAKLKKEAEAKREERSAAAEKEESGEAQNKETAPENKETAAEKAKEPKAPEEKAAGESESPKQEPKSGTKSGARKSPEKAPTQSNSKEDDAFKLRQIFFPGETGEDNPKAESEGAGEEAEEEQAPVEVREIESIAETYASLSAALLSVVKGQDQAVKKFVEGCFQGDLFKQTERGKHPRSYFFFFGPPGTGKTLLAETAAEALGIPSEKYDMSDYSTNLSHEELIGTPKIYGNAKEGRLVKFVAENPECLLIFDEIEKADIGVIRLFLQILGSGSLRSKYNEKNVSFKDAIIIFTSNVGKELYADRSVDLTTLPERVLIDAIQKEKNARGDQALPNEICSRIAAGNTILFNHLNIRHLSEMVNSNFEKIVSGMREEYGCSITYSYKLPLLFLYNRGSEIDARVASSQSGNFLKKEIYELMRQIENRKDGAKITSIDFDIEWEELDDELKSLFVNESRTSVLVLSDREVFGFFDGDSDRYTFHYADSIEKARELLKYDLTAIFIDPFFGVSGDNAKVLSIADYNTAGVEFFHEVIESGTGLPIYLIDVNPPFSEVDRRTFLQEGAAGTIQLDRAIPESFRRSFDQIMDELYMEKKNLEFSQRGWVIDFKTKQDVSGGGDIRIVFYDLKKRMAVDMDSRGSLLSEAERPKVSFDDIIGAEKAKEELQYFIGYLKNPRKFILEGHKPPEGVLLYGPPGTGKTMLAKAMAGESDVAFIQATAAGFANKWEGESEENIRRLFRRAKKYAPAIIFIDEIDAIGKQRDGSDPHRESQLNTLLTEMQGFNSGDPAKPVFVLAATNYGVDSESGIGALDSALVRRFDNKIYVDLPNEEERRIFIEKQLAKKGITISGDVIKNVAERTPGQSLAILQNIIDLAFRDAAKKEKTMDGDDLLSALEDYEFGEKKEHSEDYYRRVAIHETGHAYISYLSGDEPSYITIESRGNFGGYMQHANSEETPSYTRTELIGQIRTSLAGRAAEIVFYGPEVANNTGASSDLQHATNLAFRMLCTYGMEEGQFVVLGRDELLRSTLAGEYVSRVNELLKTQMDETIALIREGQSIVRDAADELVRANRLTGEEFAKIMERHGVKPAR